mmetsp:Transcript_6281/g.9599  ORF Transcript_6281/g.9599 Transcript_6281/m.9599 type:complete len:170 (-) Transcript_6281:85-594(-)
MADLQSKVTQLTSQIEGQLTTMVDEIEKQKLRPMGRNMHSCIVSCYDKIGKSGRKEQIEQCAQNCQMPYQQAGQVTQQEIGNFQNRLQNGMMQCQNDAQAMVTPDMQGDEKKMRQVENNLFKCIEGAVGKSKAELGPMRQRIESRMVVESHGGSNGGDAGEKKGWFGRG